MADNVTPFPGQPAKPTRGPKEVALALGRIQKEVHVVFCTLECASAGLGKAETDGDMELWIRAARVVERCCEDLESIRADVDEAASIAAYVEVAHG